MKRRIRRSNKVVLVAVCMVLAVLSLAAAATAETAEPRLSYVPNEYIIRMRAGTSFEAVEELADRIGATVLKSLALDDTYLLRLGVSRRIYAKRGVTKSSTKPATWTIEHIQPNFIYHLLAIPNDEHWDRLWGMRQINAPEAWDIEKGGAFVIVAVNDTGVGAHPDLVDRLLDGYDTIDDDNDASPVQDPDPYSNPSHGTHVAGTVAAQGDNGIGVVGVCWDNVKILPVRVFGLGDIATTASIVGGLDVALQMGADVVNMSYGGGGRRSRGVREDHRTECPGHHPGGVRGQLPWGACRQSGQLSGVHRGQFGRAHRRACLLLQHWSRGRDSRSRRRRV